MKYKILAFDLDGTLTNSEKIVTERTKKALANANANGATIVLASGRPTHGILPVAKMINLDQMGGYILACNGGTIINAKTMEIIHKATIPEEYVKPIIEYAKSHNYSILTYNKEGNMVVTNKINKYVEIEATINHLPILEIEDLGSFVDYPCEKFLITEDESIVSRELPKVAQSFSELNVFTSAPYFLEIVPPNIDKGESLTMLCEHIGLSVDKLAAFGDGGNDVSMIKTAGLGVAMANANDECKKNANVITKSNDEDGCAIIIEELINT